MCGEFGNVSAPFKLAPVFKDYLWGGDKLKRLYGKVSELTVIAESWELSAHRDGDCLITESADASLCGKRFSEIAGVDFPLLVKLIDAKKDLSIQVHPDDDFALAYENSNGKAEMWYILDAEQDAFLYIGLNRDVTEKQLADSFLDGSVTELLNKVRVKKGDAFYIAPGTIHAINGGILIAEIQQSSNVTYRVYDYGRIGNDGKPRELHVDKAAAVADKARRDVAPLELEILREADGFTESRVVRCGHFGVSRVSLDGRCDFAGCEGFRYLQVLNGEIDVASREGVISARAGEGVFIPSGAFAASEKAAPFVRGTAEFLVVFR